MIRIILVTIAIALASSMAYTDEQNIASEYANMVCAGHWPDYQQMEPKCHDN